MKLALIGYGKMGKTIARIAQERGHEIAVIVDAQQGATLEDLLTKPLDAAIEFTQPEAAFTNIRFCLEHGIPVISGTTGWLEHWEEIAALCSEQKGTFFYASNFSIGVNLFFKLNAYLSRLMADHKAYDVGMTEIHHTEKKDSPSGTALSLTKPILQDRPELNSWKETHGRSKEFLPIHSLREGMVPGTHRITYQSETDKISIEHEAFGREGFAQGVVLVTEWLKGKKGMLNMDNFLSI